MARVLRPWRQRTRHTPLGERRIPPHLARRNSAAMRPGPNPGCPREKAASTRCSTKTGVALGILGAQRSRDRKISSPWRRTCRRQR